MIDTREKFERFIEITGRISAAQVHTDEARRLERAAQPSCGNCQHWMKKSDCWRERLGQKPSMYHYPCQHFVAARSVGRLLAMATAEHEKAIAILGEKP